jgi:very-short-patch-repair endonuclease
VYDIDFEFQRVFWNDKEKIGYIVDFYVPRCRIVFEIDGGYHDIPEQQEKDKKRDVWLTRQTIKVCRIKNEEVSDEAACTKKVFELLKNSKYYRQQKKRKKSVKGKSKIIGTGRFIDGVEIKEVIGGKPAPLKKWRPRKKKVVGCKLEPPGTFSGSVLWKR